KSDRFGCDCAQAQRRIGQSPGRRDHLSGFRHIVSGAMSVIEARAFWIAAPGRGELRAEALPPPRPDQVVVRALFSGISRGTESLVFQGRVPPSERQRMTAPFQAGEFPAPVKYGYANVGTIEQGPNELRGRTAFALYPHQTRYVVPAGALHVVPDAVPAARAVRAAQHEPAINGGGGARHHAGA